MSARTTTLQYQATDPRRRALGWAVVILLHVGALWALVTGTARKGLELIKKPLEAAVIQEVIIPPPPPPPPPKEKPPEQKIIKTEAPPPPPFIPPPEVVAAPSTAPVIESVQAPPTQPVVIAPPPPPAPPAPAPAPATRTEIAVACPTQVPPEMPRQAARDGTSGVVRARVVIRDGAVRDVTIESGPRVFHAAVRAAMLQYKCQATAGEVIATQEFVFKLE